MLIHVLGSAAGGGFPQWNCNCGKGHYRDKRLFLRRSARLVGRTLYADAIEYHRNTAYD